MKKQIYTWNVKVYNINSNKIEDYDILEYKEDFIKRLKRKYKNREEFSEQLRHEMMYHYWSKCEWELIVKVIDNDVWLIPWVGCRNPDEVKVKADEMYGNNRNNFNWNDFSNENINKQIFKKDQEAKIDVYDQLIWKWNEFVDYIWE